MHSAHVCVQSKSSARFLRWKQGFQVCSSQQQHTVFARLLRVFDWCRICTRNPRHAQTSAASEGFGVFFIRDLKRETPAAAWGKAYRGAYKNHTRKNSQQGYSLCNNPLNVHTATFALHWDNDSNSGVLRLHPIAPIPAPAPVPGSLGGCILHRAIVSELNMVGRQDETLFYSGVALQRTGDRDAIITKKNSGSDLRPSCQDPKLASAPAI